MQEIKYNPFLAIPKIVNQLAEHIDLASTDCADCCHRALKKIYKQKDAIIKNFGIDCKSQEALCNSLCRLRENIKHKQSGQFAKLNLQVSNILDFMCRNKASSGYDDLCQITEIQQAIALKLSVDTVDKLTDAIKIIKSLHTHEKFFLYELIAKLIDFHKIKIPEFIKANANIKFNRDARLESMMPKDLAEDKHDWGLNPELLPEHIREQNFIEPINFAELDYILPQLNYVDLRELPTDFSLKSVTKIVDSCINVKELLFEHENYDLLEHLKRGAFNKQLRRLAMDQTLDLPG